MLPLSRSLYARLPRAIARLPWASACLAWALACGPKAIPPESVPDSPLATHNEEGKPRLTIVERSGDETPAVALAVSHNADRTSVDRALSRLRAALERDGLRPHFSVFDRGFVVSLDLPAGDASVFPVLRAALLDPRAAAPEQRFAFPFDPCLVSGRGQTPFAPGSRNVALAAVGHSAFTSAWEDALAADDEWPTGDPPFFEWPQEAHFNATDAPDETLWVALRTQGDEKLKSATEAVGGRAAVLRRGLGLLSPSWELASVHASARPRGGCLAVELTPREGPPEPKGIAQAARLADDALREALDKGDSRPFIEQALAADTAREAAAGTAWQSLHHPVDDIPPEQLDTALGRAGRHGPPRVRGLRPRAKGVGAEGLQAAFTSGQESPGLEVTTTVQSGQGQLWLALSHRCPLAFEDRNTAGHTTLALRALEGFSTSHTQLSVLMGPAGPTLVARGVVLEPGDLDRIAHDLQAALFAAFAEDGPFVDAQRQALELHRAHGLLELGASLLTDGHPSLLLHQGTSQALASARPGLLRNALRTYLGGPLRLFVLANADASQGERLGRELPALLEPFEMSEPITCPKPPPSPRAGQFGLALEEAEPPNTALLLYPIPPEQLAEGTALAALLNGPDGPLARALEPLTGITGATAAALGSAGGSAALVIEVRSEGSLKDATAQIRGLIETLRKVPLAKSDLLRAGAALRRVPVGSLSRLADLIYPPAANPSAGIAALLRNSLSEERLTLIVPAD